MTNTKEIKQDKKKDIEDRAPKKNLSWIPFIVAITFMIPTSILLYPEMWIRMYFALEIHSNVIFMVTGLVFAGAVFIKLDNWLRNIGKESNRRIRNSSQMSKKMTSSNSAPDIYDVKLDAPKFKFQRRDRDFSSTKQLGTYRHENMLKSDDMDKLDRIMNPEGSGDMSSFHNHGNRYGGGKRSGRR